MIRLSWKYLVFGAVLTGTVLTTTPQADAHWWGRCPQVIYPCAYSYSTCGSSCCNSRYGVSYALGWRPGPIRRVLFGRYRWYPVTLGYSWSCCSSYTWEPCCNQVAVASPSATEVTPEVQKPMLASQKSPPLAADPSRSSIQDDLLLPEKTPPVPKKATDLSTSEERIRGQSGLLSVNVPTAAKVYVNGRETRAVGGRREYVSFGLQEGKVYPYTIRALVLASSSEGQRDHEGRRWVWITKTVYLRAGDRIGVTFSDNLNLESQLAQVEPANIR